jgi:hypothetical protein
MTKLHTLILFLILSAPVALQGQCLPLPATSCEDDIPFICNVNGYCGQTLDGSNVTDVFDCGASTLDLYGLQVIEFLATGSALSLTINYSACNGVSQAGGTAYGMSALLLEKCDEDEEALDCASAFTQSGSLTLSINAEADEEYVLVLSGWLGNMCSYEITVNSGADSIPGLVITNEPWQGPTDVCGFVSANYIAPEVLNAEEYIWTLPGNVILETETPMLTIVFDQNTPAGVFEICVSAENACGFLNDYACLDVLVQDVVSLNIDTTLCSGDTLSAFGQQYAAPGSYTYESTGPNGCDTVATILVNAFELPTINAEITPDNGSGSGSIDLNVTGGEPPFQYMFSHVNGSTNLVAGAYAVTVTDANGCSVIFEFVIPLETATNLNSNTFTIPVSPNPAILDQPIFIQSAALDKIQTIVFINMQGQVIWGDDELHITDSRLVLPGISTPGLYQVRMIGKDGELWIGRVMVLSEK